MKLRDDLTLRQVGEDYMIVDPSQGAVDLSRVYTLNSTAAWLWAQLQGQDFDAATVSTLLMAEFEVDADQAAADAETLVANFQQQGLLQQQG